MNQNPRDLHTREYSLADGRTVITRRINAPTEVVWSVLADGWMYATWAVGASRIRTVEPDWPTPGSRLHHSTGTWPVLINDQTEVVAADPGRELLLRARSWPAGEALYGFASLRAAPRTRAPRASSRMPPAGLEESFRAPPVNC